MGEYIGADLRIMDKKMEATKDIAVGSIKGLLCQKQRGIYTVFTKKCNSQDSQHE